MNGGVDREPRGEAPPEDAAGEPEGGERAAGEAADGISAASESPRVGETRRPRRKRRHEKFRVPAWVVLILGPLTGWLIAGILGAILGLAIGVVAWRSRA